MLNLKSLIMIVVACFFSTNANAIVVQYGLNDVEISGELYDVTFYEDPTDGFITLNQAFGSTFVGNTTPFSTASELLIASQEIINAIIDRNFEASPNNPYDRNVFSILYDITLNSYKHVNGWVEPDLGAQGPYSDFNRDDIFGSSFVSIVASSGQAPEPAIILLLCLGLAGIGWQQRKSRRGE